MTLKKVTTQVGDVDEMILSLPKDEQLIVKKLRVLVLECLPRATEKISDGVPFYSHHRLICFIWPPTSPWTQKIKNAPDKKRVCFGFNQGNLMSNEDGSLLKEGRKQMYCMYFTSLKQINEDQIRALLFEAEMVDDGFMKRKKLHPRRQVKRNDL